MLFFSLILGMVIPLYSLVISICVTWVLSSNWKLDGRKLVILNLLSGWVRWRCSNGKGVTFGLLEARLGTV